LPSGSKGAFLAHFKDASATAGFRCRLFASTNSASPGRLQLGISASANAPSAMYPEELELGASYVVVCRLGFPDNSSTLWLNPTSETDLSVVATDESASKIASAYAFRESLASGSGMGELTVDDLVVATTFAELTLSPAADLRLAINKAEFGGIHLGWRAVPEQTYSVWTGDSPSHPMTLLAADLWFWDESGWFDDVDAAAPVRFYQLSAP
jgi:hypothetical protein